MAAKADENQPILMPEAPPATVDHLSLLRYFSWAFLTFQTAIAIYRSINDPWNLAFVICSYVNLLLLVWSLHRFEKTRDNSVERKRVSYMVWFLATTLIVTFTCKTAAIMPVIMKVIVWAMAAAASAGGFYVLLFSAK